MTATLRPTTRAGRTAFTRNPRPIEHGTRGGYDRCKCDICRAYNTARRATDRATARASQPAVAAPVPAVVVRCSCGQLCPSRTALGKHTWAKHTRPPTDRERIILDSVEVAA